MTGETMPVAETDTSAQDDLVTKINETLDAIVLSSAAVEEAKKVERTAGDAYDQARRDRQDAERIDAENRRAALDLIKQLRASCPRGEWIKRFSDAFDAKKLRQAQRLLQDAKSED